MTWKLGLNDEEFVKDQKNSNFDGFSTFEKKKRVTFFSMGPF